VPVPVRVPPSAPLQGKYSEALSDYNTSIQLCPWSVDPVINRGVLLEALGRWVWEGGCFLFGGWVGGGGGCGWGAGEQVISGRPGEILQVCCGWGGSGCMC
jgi:hypothetical protein